MIAVLFETSYFVRSNIQYLFLRRSVFLGSPVNSGVPKDTCVGMDGCSNIKFTERLLNIPELPIHDD